MARKPLVAFTVALLAPIAAVQAATDRWLDWLNPDVRRLERERVALADELERLGTPSVGHTVTQYGYQHPHVFPPPDAPPWVQVDLGRKQSIDSVVLIPAQSNWQSYNRTAYGFPLRFRVDVSDTSDFTQSTLLWSCTEQDFPDPGFGPVVIPARGQHTRYARITVTKMPVESGRHFFAFAEVMVLAGNLNVAALRRITTSRQGPTFLWRAGNLVDGRTPLGPPIREEPVSRDGFRIFPEEGTQPYITFDLGRVHTVQQLRLHPIHARNTINTPGVAFPISFRIEAAIEADFSDAKIVNGRDDFANPGNNPVTISGKNVAARYLRLVVTAMKDDYVGFSEMEIYADGRNVAREAKITASPDRADRPARWPESLLNDGFTGYGRLMELPDWLREWERRRELKAALAQNEQRRLAAISRANQRAWWLAGSGAALSAVAAGGVLVASRLRRQRELTELRVRLARDLHDEIGSNLASVTLLSEAVHAEPAESAADKEDWAKVRQIMLETTGAMHEILWLVGGRDEAGADLEANLRLAAARLLGRRSVQWHANLDALPVNWPVESKRQVFLFFKEALTNIVRHSRATHIDLSAQIAAGRLIIEIADDGVGFDCHGARRGVGLASQEQRARSLGGALAIESAPGRGTRLRLDVPLEPKAPRFSWLRRKLPPHDSVTAHAPGLAH